MTGEVSLLNILEKVDEHLKETGNMFLLGENLSKADCYFLPTVQHLRVAGKVNRIYPSVNGVLVIGFFF